MTYITHLGLGMLVASQYVLLTAVPNTYSTKLCVSKYMHHYVEFKVALYMSRRYETNLFNGNLGYSMTTAS